MKNFYDFVYSWVSRDCFEKDEGAAWFLEAIDKLTFCQMLAENIEDTRNRNRVVELFNDEKILLMSLLSHDSLPGSFSAFFEEEKISLLSLLNTYSLSGRFFHEDEYEDPDEIERDNCTEFDLREELIKNSASMMEAFEAAERNWGITTGWDWEFWYE